VFLHINKQI